MSRRGRSIFQNIMIIDGAIPSCNYWYPNGKGTIHTSKLSTGTRNVMGKTRKIDSSETIGGQNVATTTRGIRRTYQVYINDARGPSIHGIDRHIMSRLRRSVDGRYIGPGSYCTDKIMEP